MDRSIYTMRVSVEIILGDPPVSGNFNLKATSKCRSQNFVAENFVLTFQDSEVFFHLFRMSFC